MGVAKKKPTLICLWNVDYLVGEGSGEVEEGDGRVVVRGMEVGLVWRGVVVWQRNFFGQLPMLWSGGMGKDLSK